LLALDEERVVFFCGAGVSQEDANLPDFLGLAKKVLGKLRVSKKSPAYKILKEVPKIEIQLGVPGLIAADRIFGELEKTISTEDIEKAVAESLQSPKNISSKAHKTLLKLATTKDKRTRLVTTNFDRLFEKYDNRLKTWQRPHLPDSSEISNFEGLVYLHGRVNENYSGSDKGLILSSAEFGRAYLSEGWATQFFKEIISEYVVVFVGYGADDPPVYYLLEALNKTKGGAKDIYAFQSGTAEDAEEKWQHKGVTAIPYDAHESLWKTLAAWAKRAENLESWQDKIIKMAQKNPQRLLPFQREQVMHLVSTLKGAQRFCASDNPPPATWLCVFDRAMRFETPTTITQKDGTETPVDYFNMYGLASDPNPELIDPNNPSAKREVRDAFEINDHDKRDSKGSFTVQIKGHYALSVGNLPARLYELGTWIAKVSDQPAAVWWAVRQAGIHEQAQERIKQSLQDKTDVSPDIAKAWHYLFDSW
ncbi:MAG: SIR2 family protein, partial [Proteobacteria bacterium]|nr:SIR2 family protein [Pseudomonadota bacterium]